MPENKEVEIKTESVNSNIETLRKGPEKDYGMKDVQGRHVEIPREIKTWMQKIEEDPGMANPISDAGGQHILTPSPATNPKVTLPVTRTTFVDGFKKSFDDAGRWLSIFILRLIKMKKGNVKFNEE